MAIKLLTYRNYDHSHILSHIDIEKLRIIDITNHQEYLLNFLNSPLDNIGTNKKNQHYYFIENNKLKEYRLPFNFSWVIKNKLAGVSLPSDEDMSIFEKLGFCNVISLLEDPIDLEHKTSIKIHHFKVKDMFPPTIEQMNAINDIIDSGCTIIHCKGGMGRTNTAIAGYLIKHNIVERTHVHDFLLEKRPSMILTRHQKDFLREFSNHCHKIGTINPYQGDNNIKDKTTLSSPPCSAKLPLRGLHLPGASGLPKLLMCVGYPASGKTTFLRNDGK